MDHYLVELSFVVISIIAAVIIYRWHNSPANTFDLVDALLGADGKVSLFKISQAVALSVSTWGFVILIQQGKLTEWYFTAYMSVWATASVVKTIAAQLGGGGNASPNQG